MLHLSPDLQQPCCSSSHAFVQQLSITQEEVKPEVWFHENIQDKADTTTHFQRLTPFTLKENINLSILEVLFVLLT